MPEPFRSGQTAIGLKALPKNRSASRSSLSRDRNASEQDACTPKKRSHQKTSGKPMASDIGRNAAATTVALNFPEFESFVF
ncbi:hypothetical protein [Microcoleus sp. OTE_8_concoct_300]|uniref:hypothetical protein n=1 Tax=Microcoleus sp. OTE_8_concoct_300 TaxID=2964710 RepID=UPI00403F9AED